MKSNTRSRLDHCKAVQLYPLLQQVSPDLLDLDLEIQQFSNGLELMSETIPPNLKIWEPDWPLKDLITMQVVHKPTFLFLEEWSLFVRLYHVAATGNVRNSEKG